MREGLMVRVLLVLAVLVWPSVVSAKTVRGYGEGAPEYADYVQVLGQVFALWPDGENACKIEFIEADGQNLGRGTCVLPEGATEVCSQGRCYGKGSAETEWLSVSVKFNRKRTKAKLKGGIRIVGKCGDTDKTYSVTAHWHKYRLEKKEGNWVLGRYGPDGAIVSRSFNCGTDWRTFRAK